MLSTCEERLHYFANSNEHLITQKNSHDGREDILYHCSFSLGNEVGGELSKFQIQYFKEVVFSVCAW